MTLIGENISRIRASLPDNVRIVAAVKTRSPEEISEAVSAGIKYLGHNYVQEAKRIVNETSLNAEHHLIGHLQKNKAKYAAKLFTCIQSVDSNGICEMLDRRCDIEGVNMQVLIQVNVGEEQSKSGVLFEEVRELAGHIDHSANLTLSGLMTIEPVCEAPSDSRKYFRRMKILFDKIRSGHRDPESFSTLSMGMSGTYMYAVEEGANMIRLGTVIFGPRT